ncbi:hypothetical protein AEQ67_06865 [Pseudomonas sp. RIT-PI-q]|uniref:DUF6124 family protein n=1 Tax=Pseudomonas sp. RIT-PI-q TaxID=1690247 RepID=UPI0006CCAE3E|nr:DUF6124 family protein [Pseudomonas sp. RIT-PI-q]KPH00371.1 hypothetical protein AEQ67_06865 [Pseudomonas sp. RIT-PI-q]
MKKPRLYLIKNPDLSESDSLDLTQSSKAMHRRVSARPGNPRQVDPARNIFTVNPDVDAPTLLANASQNLASLKVMSTALTARLDGRHRNVALGIQRLVVLAEMLVNQAQKKLGSPESPA